MEEGRNSASRPSAGACNTILDGASQSAVSALRTGDQVASTPFTTQGNESRTAESHGDSRIQPTIATFNRNNELSGASSTPPRSNPLPGTTESIATIEELEGQLLAVRPERTPLPLDKAVLLILLGRDQSRAAIISFMTRVITDDESAMTFIRDSAAHSCNLERYAYVHCDRNDPGCPFERAADTAESSYEEYVPPPTPVFVPSSGPPETPRIISPARRAVDRIPTPNAFSNDRRREELREYVARGAQ